MNKTGRYPIGHPQILVGPEIDAENIRQYYGLVKCSVLPPQHLFHPLLPIRMNNKLMFVLCRQCALEEDPGPCRHSPDERALTDTWASPELFAALDEGYELMEVGSQPFIINCNECSYFRYLRSGTLKKPPTNYFADTSIDSSALSR